eukprot:9683336-Alexandrium_andersonii.AAC.1
MLNASANRVDALQAAWAPLNINARSNRRSMLACGNRVRGEGLLRGEGSLTVGAVVLLARRIGLGLLGLGAGLGAARPPCCQTR